MKRAIPVVLCIVLLVTALTACTSTASPDASQAAASATAPATTTAAASASASGTAAASPSAAATTDASSTSTASAGLANPVKDSTAQEINDTLGIPFNIPTDAQNVKYSIIDAGSGAKKIAQAAFTLNGVQYTFRIQSATAFADISGANFTWTKNDTADVSYNKAEVHLIDGKQGICQWYDTVPGLMYSLYADSGATKDTLSSVANKLFTPMQEHK